MKSCLYATAFFVAVGLVTPAVHAQSLRLQVANHAPGEPVQVHVGDIVHLQIVADFLPQNTAGVAAYLTLPEDTFLVQDLGLPGQRGTQPFRLGPLFEGALLPTNSLLTESDHVAAALAGQQLDLATVFGVGSAGQASGEGVVATFEILALRSAESAVIHIDNNPIRETRMVLKDGRSERRFTSTESLAITVVDPVASAATGQTWGRLKQVVH